MLNIFLDKLMIDIVVISFGILFFILLSYLYLRCFTERQKANKIQQNRKRIIQLLNFYNNRFERKARWIIPDFTKNCYVALSLDYKYEEEGLKIPEYSDFGNGDEVLDPNGGSENFYTRPTQGSGSKEHELAKPMVTVGY